MENQRYTIEELWQMFGGGLTIGPRTHRVSDEIRKVLVKTFTKMPKEIVDWACQKLIFVSSCEDHYAFALLKDTSWGSCKGFVFISDYLLDLAEEEQTLAVAHEIAHMKLRHKSSVFNNLTRVETEKQEEKANDLARKWLSRLEKKE